MRWPPQKGDVIRFHSLGEWRYYEVVEIDEDRLIGQSRRRRDPPIELARDDAVALREQGLLDVKPT